MGMLKERFDDPEFMKLARVTLPGSRKDEGYFLSLIRSYDIGEVEAADLELLARSGLHGRGIGFNVDTLCDRAKRGNYNFGHKELEESLQKRYDSMNQGEIKVVLKGASGLQTFFDSGFDEYLTEAGFVDLVDTVCETRFVDLNFLDFLVNAYLSGYKLEDDEFVRDAREAYGLFVNPPPPSPEEAEHRSYEKSKLEKLAEKFAPVEEKTYTRSLQRSARKIDKRIEDAQELQRQVETGEKDFPNKRVNGILLPDTFSSSIIGQYATDPFFNWFNAFNNANAFAEAGRQYEQNFLPAKDEVNIVYVAAGYHVAPLEVALQLFEQGAVNRANYVYTDVDEQSMNDYVTVLSLLKEQGLFKEVTVEDSNVDVGEEKRIRVTYETKSGEEKEINIRYALCGTGLRTITSDYVKDADLLIDHDSGFVGLAGDPMTRRAEFMLEYWKAQNPDMVFLVEGGKPLSNLDADTIANTDHYYGCRGDNALHPKQADHLRLDQPEELDGFVLVKPDSNYLEMSKREMLNTIRTKRE